MSRALLALVTFGAALVAAAENYDVIIKGGDVFDGSGSAAVKADLAILNGKIAAMGDLSGDNATETVNAEGMAVTPGFINMLSWATESLIEDGRSLSDIKQGVTLEVFGEGWSMGPLHEGMRELSQSRQGDISYPVTWTRLSGYLDFLVDRGVSCNVASFVGATTVRIHVIGYDDRAPTVAETAAMRGLVRQAMEDGALGLGSSLIYAPAFYATTEELTEMCEVVAEYDGLYATHLRSEANRFLEALDEFLTIVRESGVRGEVYHLKAAGKANWHKLDEAIARIEAARAAGMGVTADMYTYVAGATGLDASMPPWVQEGGHDAWVERLKDPDIRKRVAEEMNTPTDEWENFFTAVESPDDILLVGFKNDELKPLTGKTLAEVAAIRGTTPAETAMDLVIEDDSRVGTVYFLMSEENIRKKIKQPWVSFCSDSASLAPEGVFLKSQPHPRAYGSFARLLGKYVREEKVIPLEDAIYRLTGLPAENLRLKDRGLLKEGYWADVVVFDPETITDHATFEAPHQLATGVHHVWVNGEQVLKDGEHTGAKPGMVVHGPGRTAH